MGTPFFYLQVAALPAGVGTEPTARVHRDSGPTCQAAECAGHAVTPLAIQTTRRRGGFHMAKKAAKKKAAKKAAKKR